jgi:hypothetical protein
MREYTTLARAHEEREHVPEAKDHRRKSWPHAIIASTVDVAASGLPAPSIRLLHAPRKLRGRLPEAGAAPTNLIPPRSSSSVATTKVAVPENLLHIPCRRTPPWTPVNDVEASAHRRAPELISMHVVFTCTDAHDQRLTSFVARRVDSIFRCLRSSNRKQQPDKT